MPALSLAPAFSLLAAFQRASPVHPLRTLLRTAEDKRNPSCAAPHRPEVRAAQDDLLARGGAGPHQRVTVLREHGKGRTPTLVLGGFVPDSTEQVFLLRQFFLRAGDLYYFNYPRHGFSLDLVCAQLDDLVAELERRGQPPVIFSVSFGCGLVLEWLRRCRLAGRQPALAGVVLVSPVACTADLISPSKSKPGTLLGRALQPYLDAATRSHPGTIEKSRLIFARMFEAGAQNKLALATLLTRSELKHLHAAVMTAIRGITLTGATERVRALDTLVAPSTYFSPALLPLTDAPALVLFAEREDAVIEAGSPTRFALESAPRAYFSRGRVRIIVNRFGPPVQHASLIFHAFDFLPAIEAFYRPLKGAKLEAAA
jgi:hypothetical protein